MYLSRGDLGNESLCAEIAAEIRTLMKGRLLLNEPLSAHTSFMAGGQAKFYVYPSSIQDLSNLVVYCKDKGLERFVIGYGTNLLVSDAGFAGCIIDLAAACDTLTIEGPVMCTGAGVWGNDAVELAARSGLAGIHKLAGIPGGIGGWVRMHCGAFRSTVSDCLVSVGVMEHDGTTRSLTKEEAEFGYRSSPGLDGKMILGAEFKLENANTFDVLKAVEETIAERHRRNVMTLPSAGSVFKNPEGHFAARMIESVDGKGMSVGGAEVSMLHANFIINKRGGTASDIVELIAAIREKVLVEYNIRLELEVKTLGFDENDPAK